MDQNNKQKYLFCDKLLTSYILCINKFTKEHSDCKIIYNALSKLESCKENNNALYLYTFKPRLDRVEERNPAPF